jgi:DUF1680 family protein
MHNRDPKFSASNDKTSTYTKKTTAIIDTSTSPIARLRSIPLDSVRWTEGYWAARYKQICDVTVRRLWELLTDPDAGHVLDNLRIAAGLQKGKYAGTNWQDAWSYKWIEAAACIYRTTDDKWLDERMDEAIEIISRAQESDGYIASQITAQGKKRFQNPREHEVYTMGHLITAAVIHHRMTGKDSLLNVAIRTADFLCRTLGVSVEPYFAHNPSAIMGLAELYRTTGRRKYLDCAKLIVDKRGANPRPMNIFQQQPGINSTDLIQDRVPLRQETEVVGHNVFFTYLFAGATDIYLETGDETLREALLRLWQDLTGRKMCINGGVSPMGQGLSHSHPVVEAVGPAYFLPNALAYNETCGQIGNFMWNYRMLCCEAEACYADTMELSIYNGILSGIGTDGESWFYRNPLRRYDSEYSPSGHNDMVQRAQPGRRQICCPTNLLRTIAELQSYFYSLSEGGIWIHHYGGNEFSCSITPDANLNLEQRTEYPWDGKIEITMREVVGGPFFIKARIPGWVEAASIKVNGAQVDTDVKPGTYATIERNWAAGDTIEIDLPMPARLMHAHPRAEQLRNQVAVMRGPVLYCLESIDLPGDVDLNGVYIPSDISLSPVPASDLPFGIRALQGEGVYRREAPWKAELYRGLQPVSLESIPLRLVPYFAWANRGPSAMSVWLPVRL